MSTTELSKEVRGNDELIKIKNKQVFSVFIMFIIILLCFVLRGNFLYGEGTIKGGVGIISDRYFLVYHTHSSYYITNPEAYSEYMQNGLEVEFIGAISHTPGYFPAQVIPIFFPRIHLLYVREHNEFLPISLMLLLWELIYLACIVGIFGIIYLLYKILMFKDKRMYLKSSKRSMRRKKIF